jgi:acetyl-CoA acetyltransferase
VVGAVAAVGSGLCRHVLVCRALNGPTGRYGYSNVTQVGGPAQFDAPYGVTPPTTWAQMWTRYQQLYRTGTREQMATLVVQERHNGLLWPHGYWAAHKPVPLDVAGYLDARMVSTPLAVFDCDIPVHGAGAFVVSAADAAADAPQAAWLRALAPAGYANGNALRPWHLEQERASGENVAGRLWRRSGLTPADIDLANIYDGFSIIAMLWLECLGFCGPGEAFGFVQNGRIGLDGELPVNTAGGNLGAGRMHGIPQLMDAVLQVTGRSGPRQVAGAELALVSIGQQSGGGALILGSDPY